MLETINIYDAKTRLSSLVSQVEAGGEITIARAGRPVARLVPVKSGPSAIDRAKAFGSLKSTIWVAEDFDSWPPGFIEGIGANL